MRFTSSISLGIGFPHGSLLQSLVLAKAFLQLMLGTSTALDIEEVLSQTRRSDFHIFVADVVKSFDTVDRDILDCTLGRLGLPAWVSYGLFLLS